MKPQTYKLDFEDSPYCCKIQGEMATVSGYGHSSEEAYDSMMWNIKRTILDEEDFGIADIVQWYLDEIEEGL